LFYYKIIGEELKINKRKFDVYFYGQSLCLEEKKKEKMKKKTLKKG